MKNTNIYVFAKITPKPEFYNETASELAGILAATRSEDGCHKFDLHTSECERYLYLYEEWSDKASLENHHQQEHTKQAAEKLQNWLSEETEVSIMNKFNA